MKWAVRRVTVDGHFNLPKGFVWVCMGKHTHFITQEGTRSRASQMHDSQLYFCVNSRQWLNFLADKKHINFYLIPILKWKKYSNFYLISILKQNKIHLFKFLFNFYPEVLYFWTQNLSNTMMKDWDIFPHVRREWKGSYVNYNGQCESKSCDKDWSMFCGFMFLSHNMNFVA